MATVAGGADAAALAGEYHDESLAAARAEGACESKTENAALEIAAEVLLDEARHGSLGRFLPGELKAPAAGEASKYTRSRLPPWPRPTASPRNSNQNVAAVSQPVQHCAGQPSTAENHDPVLEGQVHCDDQAVAFVRGGDDIEEQFRPSLARRDVAEFVENRRPWEQAAVP